jgi:uncharacterized protein YigE (DUF2233 family)
MIQYHKRIDLLEKRNVWVIEIENDFLKEYTLLLSKVSEALNPNTTNNQVGEGGTLEDVIKKQKGIKFIINGGFNHYRKNFYEWKNQNFHIGDPVGLVKIREHYFEDYYDINQYGFFIQENKYDSWKIVNYKDLKKSEKYILGCTPLLIYKNKPEYLRKETMQPNESGKINPPSILGHGLQKHARTAVGIKKEKIYFILVECIKDGDGCTLEELQKIGLKLNLEYLLNLDGGGSSKFLLKEDNNWIQNKVLEEDKNRILGNAIILFDEKLK